MLNPGMINRIRRDFAILINGADGNNVTLSWKNPGMGGVVDPVYKDLTGPSVSGTLDTRCHVNKIFGQNEIQAKKLVDVIAGDAIMLFDKSVDLTNKGNLTATIAGLGQWQMVENPPSIFQSYSRLLVSGESFVQSVFMRRVAT